VLGGVIALLRQVLGNLRIGFSLSNELADCLFHLCGERQPRPGADLDSKDGRRGITALPDNADLNPVWRNTVHDHFVDQAT